MKCCTSSTIAKPSPTHLIAHGYLFLDQLVQSSANRQEGRERRLRDFYIKEALVFIDRNYQRDISIEEIAAVCGLNRSYFGKVFRDSVGESPQAYLFALSHGPCSPIA